MRTRIHKLFSLWNFDKEEQWLNEMAAKGLALVDVGFARYDFEDSDPGEYQVRLELLNSIPNHLKSQEYIHFLEDTGAEHVATLMRWVYFRKKTADGAFDLFSDIDSRIRHLNRILLIPAILGAMNLINLANWARTDRYGEGLGRISVAVVISAAALLMVYGFIRIYLKKLRLQKERDLYE